MEIQVLFDQIRRKDSGAMKEFVSATFSSFVQWVLFSYQGVTREDAEDIYQEALVIFVEKIRSGGLAPETLKVKPKTYIFGIGKNLLNNQKRGARANVGLKEWEAIPVQNASRMEVREVRQFWKEAILNLSEECRRILTLAFYRNYSVEAISEELNESPVKISSRKYRCIARMRKFFASHPGYISRVQHQ